jgi:hypothetical protein
MLSSYWDDLFDPASDISHYGVKGMKWGFGRNAIDRSASKRKPPTKVNLQPTLCEKVEKKSRSGLRG